MTKRKHRLDVWKTGMAICFSFMACTGSGQRVQTYVDKKDILIGEQLQYKVKASYPPGAFNVHWFSIPDSLPHFELVDKGRVDSSAEDGSTVFQQTITLTSFDSGRWNTPAFMISFDPPGSDSRQNVFTDSVAINVGYSPADSTNQLRDIKPIINVTVTDYTLYYIIAGILLVLIIGIVLYFYLRKQKKEKPAVPPSKLGPYEEAMAEIGRLSQLDLQNPVDIKQYHSLLSVIFKRYLGRRKNKNLLTKTTGDILIRMGEAGMTTGDISVLATALRCTDAVKFAKYLPPEAESQDCLAKIKETIHLIEHQTSNIKP